MQWLKFELEELKKIKNALGGTVNDVFLAVVSGALGRWLRRHGVRTEGLELRAIVPVSIRGDEQKGALGNRITAMLGPLPVYARDPLERYRIVSESMSGLKESKQAVGAEALTRLQDFAPPTILAQASRLNFSTRAYNVLVTNVPGPQFPLYLIGRELQELVPVPFLAPERALAVAMMSYNGSVDDRDDGRLRRDGGPRRVRRGRAGSPWPSCWTSPARRSAESGSRRLRSPSRRSDRPC